MADSPYIVSVSAENFAQEVLEKSNTVPVLVDFWADWCSPCKTLMPVLEQLVESYQGQFILAKINIDQDAELAAQFKVRSVPTLKLVRNGQIVDEALGVQPESVLRAMIDAHRVHPADDLRRQAAQAHREGNGEEALRLLRTACELEPEYYPSQLDLAKVLVETGQFTEADTLLRSLPASVQADLPTKRLMAWLGFGVIASEAPDPSTLQTQLEADPDNHQARYQLSALLVLNRHYEAALSHLLELMRRSRKFNDDAGRRGLVDVFLLLNNEGPVVAHYRSKMASLLY